MASIFYNNVEYGGAGNEVHYGTTIPASSLGVSGDAYFRLDANGNLIEQYIKLGSNWTLVPKSDAVLGTKTITQNGTYPALTDSLDGFSSVEVNVSGGGSILITKTITQNGTYDAEDDNADGYSSVTVNVSGGGGGNITLERLCFAYEDQDALGSLDHTHIAYFDAITKDTNYSSYLSNNDIPSGSKTEVKFTVLSDFDAYIVPWVYEYETASTTNAQGKIMINGNEQVFYGATSRSSGAKGGQPFFVHLTAGDELWSYTPSSNGYPQQYLKIYKVDNLPSNLISAIATASEFVS